MRSRIDRAVTSDGAGLVILELSAIVRGISYFRVSPDRIPAHWLKGNFPRVLGVGVDRNRCWVFHRGICP